MPPSWNVFWKEALSFFRDRRAVINQLLLPVLLMPVFAIGPAYLIGKLGQAELEKTQVVAVKGAPGGLIAELKKARFQVKPDPDPEKAVREGAADLGLIVEPGRIRVFAKVSQEGLKAEALMGKLNQALEAYKARLVAERLRAAGLDPSVLTPFVVETVDVSPPEAKKAGFMGFLIPMFLLMFIIGGSMSVIIDATAGEKERGTLEVLLAAPVRVWDILMGKLLAALLVGFLSTLAGILGLMLAGLYTARAVSFSEGGEAEALSFGLQLDPRALVLLFVTGVLFATMVVGIELALGVYARSYKEAQSSIGILYMVVILPIALLGTASAFIGENPAYYAIPIVGPALYMDAVLKAKADLTATLITWGSTLFYAGLTLVLAYRSFTREEAVFRN